LIAIILALLSDGQLQICPQVERDSLFEMEHAPRLAGARF